MTIFREKLVKTLIFATFLTSSLLAHAGQITLQCENGTVIARPVYSLAPQNLTVNGVRALAEIIPAGRLQDNEYLFYYWNSQDENRFPPYGYVCHITSGYWNPAVKVQY